MTFEPRTRITDSRRARLMAWAMSGVWLVFLAFPVMGLVHEPARVAVPGLGLMAVFVVIYLWLLRTLGIYLRPAHHRRQAFIFAGLVLVALVSMLVDPGFALVYCPYLVAAAGFGLWSPVNRIVSATVLGVTTVGALTIAPRFEGNSMLLVGLLNLFISWVATASIERGQRDASLRHELAVIDERNRIASDVHDLLGHSLTVVNLKLQLVSKLVDTDPVRARHELDETRAIVAEALSNVRRTVSMERSSSLADELEQTRKALSSGGVEFELVGSAEVAHGPVALVLGWVVREATTNVLRHAHASTCRVTIAPGRLEVADDGDGRMGRREGNGTRGMRERVAAAGGELRVCESELGGTSVEVTW